jgi:hypothetical protein
MDIDGHTIENLETTRTPDATGDQPLRLGANSLDLDKYFNGEVDELRVWNRGLAINELSQIYTNRNFTTNGQVEYLNFGKNIMEDNKERIDDDNNKSITNTTKEELLTTLGTTKQPPVIFVFVISKDILQELLTATAKQPPIIVEPKTPPPSTVTNNNSKTNTTTEELLATTTKKQQPPIIVEPQAPSKNATKEELPTTTTTTTKKQQPPIVTKEQPPIIVEPKTPSKTNTTKEELPTTTTTKKQQPPIIVEPQPQTPSKTNATKEGLPTTTTTKKQQQQPPIIVKPKTSNQITTAPTLLSNNISKNTADNVRDKINLAFENLSVERSVTNSVVIKGDIKNNSTQDLQEVKVFAEYYDKTGTLLAKIDHFITSPSSILKPTEQVSFDILEVLGFGFHKLGDYNIVASGEIIN